MSRSSRSTNPCETFPTASEFRFGFIGASDRESSTYVDGAVPKGVEDMTCNLARWDGAPKEYGSGQYTKVDCKDGKGALWRLTEVLQKMNKLMVVTSGYKPLAAAMDVADMNGKMYVAIHPTCSSSNLSIAIGVRILSVDLRITYNGEPRNTLSDPCSLERLTSLERYRHRLVVASKLVSVADSC